MSCDGDRRSKGNEGWDTTEEPVLTPPAICETILSVLNRDHSLRRAYLRRRWQGLID